MNGNNLESGLFWLNPPELTWNDVGRHCTPGMVLSTVALLKEKPNPTDADIQSGLAGQLCRCCGYPKILKAVHHAAEQLRK